MAKVRNIVPPYLLCGLRVMVENLLERQDNNSNEMKEEYEKELENKQKVIDEQLQTIENLEGKILENYFKIDDQAQYNRRENLKIHGIEYQNNENIVEIIKDIGKFSGVKIEDGDISCGHRLMSKVELDKRAASSVKSSKIPQLIVRFSRRDIKDKLHSACKNLQYNAQCPESLKNIRLYEDVTPLKI